AGRQEIEMTNNFGADLTGRDVTWPARQKWNAMAALPRVAFDAAQTVHAAMPILADALVRPGIDLDTLRSVVAAKDDDCVGLDSGAGHRCADGFNRGIDLSDKIAVRAGLASTVELGQGNDRIMGCRE